MKKHHNILSVVILALGLFFFSNSCTIQKRVHRKGWHITWNTNKHAGKQEKENKPETAETEKSSQEDERYFATASQKSKGGTSIYEPDVSIQQPSTTPRNFSQDSEFEVEEVNLSTDDHKPIEETEASNSSENTGKSEPKSRRALFLTLGIIGIVLTAFAAFLTFVMLIVIAFEAGSTISLVLLFLLTLVLLAGTILSFSRAKKEKG